MLETHMNSVAKLMPNTSVIVRMGGKYGVDADKLLGTLKATCFKGDVSTEQMMALLVVAEAYNLNPFLKEIYAFPARGGIVPIVGVDGWSRIINENPAFDGMDFEDGPLGENKIPEWIECKLHRKDRSHPVAVREYFAEVNRGTDPWKSHPRRMLRHKSLIQAARLAFGYTGIYDEDEGQRIAEEINITPAKIDPRGDGMLEVDYALRDKHVAEIGKLFDEFGADEKAMGEQLKAYVAANFQGFQELQIAVWDRLSNLEMATKGYLRKLMQ
jgi:phage recombination protein Bet